MTAVTFFAQAADRFGVLPKDRSSPPGISLLQAAVPAGAARQGGVEALNTAPARSAQRVSFNEPDKIADNHYLVGRIVLDLRAGELIFNCHHQFETIKRVSPEVVEEARPIRDAFSVYAQLLGNDVADHGGHALVRSRFSLQMTMGSHVRSPESLQIWVAIRATIPPRSVTALRNFQSVALAPQLPP